MNSVVANARYVAHQTALRFGIGQLLEINNLSVRQLAKIIESDRSHLEKQLAADLSSEQRPIGFGLLKKLRDSESIFIPAELYETLMVHDENAKREHQTTRDSLRDEHPDDVTQAVSKLRMDSLHLKKYQECAQALTEGLTLGADAVRILADNNYKYHSARCALVMHDLLRTANFLAESVFYGKFAEQLLHDNDFEDAAIYKVNAMYAQATTLRLIGNAERAIYGLEQVKQEKHTMTWAVHAERERLMAQLMLPMFDYEQWFLDWTLHRKSSEKFLENQESWEFTLQKIHAQALLLSRKRKDALALYESLMLELDQPFVTVVTRTSFLKGFGQTWCEQTKSHKDFEEGLKQLRQAEDIAIKANLTHQRKGIRSLIKKYGTRH